MIQDPPAVVLASAASVPAATVRPAPDGGTLFVDLLPTMVVLLVIAVVGGIAILWIRRSLKAAKEPEVGFTLEDLRRLHRSGGLNDDEFARAKERMLASRPSRESMADKLIPNRRAASTRRPPKNADGPPRNPPAE